MPVSETATTTAEEFYLFAVLGHFTEKVAGLGVEYYRAAGYFYDFVLTVFAETAVARSALSVAGKNMTLIFQWQKSPHVFIAAEYYVAAATTVASVRTSFGYVLRTVKVSGAGAALTGAAQYLHVVDKIGFCHNYYIFILSEHACGSACSCPKPLTTYKFNQKITTVQNRLPTHREFCIDNYCFLMRTTDRERGGIG